MDVDLLSKIIKELILDKDRVVLPGLGCFVAEMVPSTFSDKGYTINPPYRKLSFRSKPDIGDELIDFYVEANELDRDVACRILGDFIRELRQVIFTKKVVILPGLGRLRATKENHLFFIPEEGLDIYPAGIGLEPISLKTHVETQQEVASAVAGLKSIMEEVVVAGVQEDKVEEVVETAEEVVVAVAEEVVEEEVVVEAESSEPVAEEIPVVAEEKPKKSDGKKFMITMIVLVVLAVVLLAAFAVVARMMPGVFDTIVYTPEELEILNYIR
jgi:nucleoid DNA-binding protein